MVQLTRQKRQDENAAAARVPQRSMNGISFPWRMEEIGEVCGWPTLIDFLQLLYTFRISGMLEFSQSQFLWEAARTPPASASHFLFPSVGFRLRTGGNCHRGLQPTPAL
jgi:hypothetical protein